MTTTKKEMLNILTSLNHGSNQITSVVSGHYKGDLKMNNVRFGFEGDQLNFIISDINPYRNKELERVMDKVYHVVEKLCPSVDAEKFETEIEYIDFCLSQLDYIIED